MSDLNDLPTVEPLENGIAETEPTYRLEALVRGILSTIRTALLLSPIFLIVIILILAMLGPAIGNIYSNIVTSL